MTRRIALRLAAAGAGLITAYGCASVERISGWSPSPCHDTTVSLYFESASDTVSDVGLQIIDATSKHLRGCKVSEIKLLGLSDATGSPSDNLDLSKRRADHVLDAFVRAGLPVPKYTLVAAGGNGAVTPQGAVEPLRRRVDVTVSARK